MGTTFLVLAAILVALIVFLRAPPSVLAHIIKSAIPLTLIVAGVIVMALGRMGLGMLLMFAGVGLYRRLSGFWPTSVSSQKGPKRSSVRAAALEMELDHDTGEMNGIVLAGHHEGKVLEDMMLEELYELRGEIVDDGQSLALLDAYLDRRFPAWREDGQGDTGAGQAGPAGAGPMSEKEAYEVLGLAAGASAAEIRAAHRRLMKTAHPDSGGSTFLAAKINEAKDILLKSHS